MPSMLRKEFWAETARAELISRLISLAIPITGTSMAAYIGYLENGFLPPLYILVAIFAVFAFSSIGIYFSYIFLYQQTVKSKLRFGNLNFSFISAPDKDKKGKPKNESPFLSGINVGLILTSSAHFPIAVNVKSISTHLDGQYAKDKKESNLKLTIDYMGIGQITDATVPIDRTKAIKGRELLEGTFQYHIEYGKTHGKYLYELKGKQKIAVYLNPRPQFPICHFYNDDKDINLLQ